MAYTRWQQERNIFRYHKIDCYAQHTSTTRKKTDFIFFLFRCVTPTDLIGIPLTYTMFFCTVLAKYDITYFILCYINLFEDTNKLVVRRRTCKCVSRPITIVLFFQTCSNPARPSFRLYLLLLLSSLSSATLASPLIVSDSIYSPLSNSTFLLMGTFYFRTSYYASFISTAKYIWQTITDNQWNVEILRY